MNKVLEVVLKLTDQFTAPLQKSEGGLKGFSASVMRFASNAAVFAAVGLAVRKSFQVFDEYQVAIKKLEGTAKITGVALSELNAIAKIGQERFGLSKLQASELAVEMAKLAVKAGDVGMAAPLLQKFLDIGAARGLTASETLKAVQQAILGIDEGTDKLFNANPSVLYKQFADAIGTTVGKLTDQQKAQALVSAAMTDGGKVVGSYGEFLLTTAGKQQIMTAKAQEFYAELGELLDPVRRFGIAVITAFTNIGTVAVNGWQMIVASIEGIIGASVGYFDKLIGNALMKTADWMGKAAALVPFLGDKMTAAADKIGELGVRMAVEGERGLRDVSNNWQDRMLEIQGIQSDAEDGLTQTARDGAGDRSEVAKGESKSRTEIEKAAIAARDRLRDAEERAQLEQLSAMGQALYKLKQDTDAMLASADQTMHSEAKDRWRKGVNGLVDEYLKIVPAVRGPTLQVRTELMGLGESLETAQEKAERLRKAKEKLKQEIIGTAAAIAQGANDLLSMGRAAGITTPQVEALVGGIASLAEGIGGIASGNLTQGIVSAISGLQGIVGSLFGDSPAEQARKQLLRDNSERLRELKREIGNLLDSTMSGAKLSAFQGAVGGMERFTQGGNGTLDRAQRMQDFAKFLADQGLTLGDASKLAGEFGIDFAGFSTQGMQDFITFLNTTEFGKFGQTFDAQLDAIRTRSSVSGVDDPARELDDVLKLLEGENVGAIASLVRGGDTATAGGVATLRSQLSTFIEQARTTGFNPAIAGNLSPGEFIAAIETVSELLGQFSFGVATPTVPAPVGEATPGLVTSGVTTSASFAGLSFMADTIDVRNMFGAPLARIDMGIARLVEFAEQGGVGTTVNVSIGTLSAGTPTDAASTLAIALDEQLRIQRDLGALTRGQ